VVAEHTAPIILSCTPVLCYRSTNIAHSNPTITHTHTHSQLTLCLAVPTEGGTQKMRRMSAGTNQGLTECGSGICHWTAKVVRLTEELLFTDVSKEPTTLVSKPKDATCPNQFTVCSHINRSEQCSRTGCNSSVDVVPRLRAACVSIPGTGRKCSLLQNAQRASEAYPVDIGLKRPGREAVQSRFGNVVCLQRMVKDSFITLQRLECVR
jgi:hypothetical protein